MKRIYQLTKANVLNVVRKRSILFATIAFPLIFIGIFGLAFSTGGIESNSPINIAIVYEENQIPDNAIVIDSQGDLISNDQAIVDEYLNLISDITYSDNVTNVFDIDIFSDKNQDDALKLVQGGDIAAILYLQSDFSLGYMAAFRNTFSSNIEIRSLTQNFTGYPSADYLTEPVIRGDQTRQEFNIARSILQSTLESYFSFGQSSDHGISIQLDTQISTEEFSVFDYILPGLVIFGILQNLGVVANVAVRDVESGLLKRLKITQITGVDYTSSLILSQLIISMIQVPIFFGVATIFGFPLIPEIRYAFVVAILMSLSVTGIGLIVASFAKSTDSAGSLSTLIAVPMAFLAGAFFIVPNPTIIKEGSILGSNSLGLLDLLTATPSIEALRLILVGGRSLSEVWFEFALLSVLTIVYLVLGVYLYSRKHLTPDTE